MGDRSPDQYKKWGVSRLLSGILTILEEWFYNAFSGVAPFTGILMRGMITDAVSRVIRLDASTNSIKTITYPHSEIHDRRSFVHVDAVDLTIGQVFDIRIAIPANLRKPHFTFEFEVESQTQWFFYETADIDVAGNVRLGVNRNRVPPLLIAIPHIDEILNANIGLANADTDITGITFELHGMTGSKKTGGSAEDRDEWILTEETTYCLRFIADVAGWISYRLGWYEHAPRD